jgi:protein tyrosine/serine phosphatase
MKDNGRGWPRSVAAVAITLLALGPATVDARETPTRSSAAITASQISIGNFGQAGDRYFRGEQPVGRDYSDLAALGVKTVIDLQADGDNADEPQLVKDAGMTFYRIPMTTHTPPTAAQLAEFLTIVTDPSRQPVYVHCAGGRHRTGVMTAVYRMAQDGWTADQAFQEMKHYKFGADFLHPEFKRFVYSYKPETTPAHAAAQVAAAQQ